MLVGGLSPAQTEVTFGVPGAVSLRCGTRRLPTIFHLTRPRCSWSPTSWVRQKIKFLIIFRVRSLLR